MHVRDICYKIETLEAFSIHKLMGQLNKSETKYEVFSDYSYSPFIVGVVCGDDDVLWFCSPVCDMKIYGSTIRRHLEDKGYTVRVLPDSTTFHMVCHLPLNELICKLIQVGE